MATTHTLLNLTFNCWYNTLKVKGGVKRRAAKRLVSVMWGYLWMRKRHWAFSKIKWVWNIRTSYILTDEILWGALHLIPTFCALSQRWPLDKRQEVCVWRCVLLLSCSYAFGFWALASKERSSHRTYDMIFLLHNTFRQAWAQSSQKKNLQSSSHSPLFS